MFGKCFTFVRIVNSYKVANCRRHLTTFDEFRIFAGSSDVVLVIKPAAAKDTMETKRVERGRVFSSLGIPQV
jgi:hypothetical protein